MANKQVNERDNNEQVKPIILHDTENQKDYTLEFDRETVDWCERRHFDIDEVVKYPMSLGADLFFYSFRMHHKNVSRERTDRILFDDLGGWPEGMLERLIQLYAAPYEALNAAREGAAKNPKMTVEF